MADLSELEQMHIEHEAWLKLCRALRATKAVTLRDLESRVGMRVTNGQIVLEEIREWGEELVRLRKMGKD